MKKIYVLDRIEDGVATVVCDDGEAINLSLDMISGLDIGDVFSAEYSGGALCDVIPMPEETQKRRNMARSILDKFKNKKHD